MLPLKSIHLGRKTIAKNKNYQEWLLDKLKDHDEESQHLFLIALRNVAEAQGGVGNLAKKAGIGRESLYKKGGDQQQPKLQLLVTLRTFDWINLSEKLRTFSRAT